MRPTPEIIKKLPKVLLHDHLDGGLRVSTIIDLARKERFPLPSEDPQELLAWFHRGANAGDLRLYLETFKVIYAALQTEEALERVAYESLLDLHADNVVYAELRFAPFFHTAKGLTHDEVMEAVLRGLRRAEGETGTRFGLIVCSMRGSQWAMPMAELAVAYRDKGAVALTSRGTRRATRRRRTRRRSTSASAITSTSPSTPGRRSARSRSGRRSSTAGRTGSGTARVSWRISPSRRGRRCGWGRSPSISSTSASRWSAA